jgi:hypothetical protein
VKGLGIPCVKAYPKRGAIAAMISRNETKTITTTSVDDWLHMNEPDNRVELLALHYALESGGYFDPYFSDPTPDGKIFLEGWNGDRLGVRPRNNQGQGTGADAARGSSGFVRA